MGDHDLKGEMTEKGQPSSGEEVTALQELRNSSSSHHSGGEDKDGGDKDPVGGSLARTSEPLELVFRNLSYSVPLPKKHRKPDGPKEKVILQDLYGVFEPGKLTAIMGSSGAGKTTLLTVLAGNVLTGSIEGETLVNGEIFSGSMLKDISGFVFQEDILLPSMTVHEAISMSALLRLPKNITKEERSRRVDDIIALLNLEKARNTIVGSPLKKGISGGERKRTAIGMEMVMNPGMLFLDEPTSGLDTFTAFTVMLSLSRLAKQGRTVVATIHQPSTEIFNLFDNLLILSRGRIAYLGPARDSIEYFARNGYQCPRYSNPSDYFFMRVLREFGTIDELEEIDQEVEMLRESFVRASRSSNRPNLSALAIGAGGAAAATAGVSTGMAAAAVVQEEAEAHTDEASDSDDSSEDPRAALAGLTESEQNLLQEQEEVLDAQAMCDQRIETLLGAWKDSPENEKIVERARNPERTGVSVSSLRSMAPFYVQFAYLLKRSTLNVVRNKPLLATRFVQAVFLGLIIGLTYVNSSSKDVSVQIINKSGALFFISVNMFFAAATQILSIFAVEKQVFYREYNGGYYTILAYYASKTIVEIPFQIVGPFLLVIICYYMIGLNPPFSDYLFVATFAALSALCGNAYGTLISSLIDDLSLALTVSPLIILPLVLVSGIFVATLPPYLVWLKYISPVYYSFSGMIQTEFSRDFPNCDSSIQDCSGDIAFTQLAYDVVFSPGVCVVFLVTIYVVLWVGGFVALYFGARRYR